MFIWGFCVLPLYCVLCLHLRAAESHRQEYADCLKLVTRQNECKKIAQTDFFFFFFFQDLNHYLSYANCVNFPVMRKIQPWLLSACSPFLEFMCWNLCFNGLHLSFSRTCFSPTFDRFWRKLPPSWEDVTSGSPFWGDWSPSKRRIVLLFEISHWLALTQLGNDSQPFASSFQVFPLWVMFSKNTISGT